MTDKFDYTETGQSDALAYINSLGTVTILSEFNGQEMAGNNAVAYANYLYAKLNPIKPNYITDEELGIPNNGEENNDTEDGTEDNNTER